MFTVFIQFSNSPDSTSKTAFAADVPIHSKVRYIQARNLADTPTCVNVNGCSNESLHSNQATPNSLQKRSISASPRSQVTRNKTSQDPTQTLQTDPRRFSSPAQSQSPLESDAASLEDGSQTPDLSILPESLAVNQRPVLREAPIPVALAVPDLELSDFSPQEKSTIQNVRDRFSASIAAAPTQDPDSPAYFDYWKSAAYLHDEQLKIRLGWQSFNQLSALAAQSATRAKM